MNNKDVAIQVKIYGLYHAMKHVLDGDDFEDNNLKIQWQYCTLLINNIERILQEDDINLDKADIFHFNEAEICKCKKNNDAKDNYVSCTPCAAHVDIYKKKQKSKK
jgi:hypothetical protein